MKRHEKAHSRDFQWLHKHNRTSSIKLPFTHPMESEVPTDKHGGGLWRVQENYWTLACDSRLLRNAGTYSQITRHHIPEDGGLNVRGSPGTRGPEVTEQWCEECIFIMKRNRSTASDLQAPCPKSIAYTNTACIACPPPTYTGCFTTLGHNCRRWFPRSLWWKKFI